VEKKPRILIAPLDWGLGHTTRVIPIIRKISEAGAFPVIAGNMSQIEFLRGYFPDAEYRLLDGYDVSYGNNVTLDIALQFRSLLQSVKRERKWLAANMENFNIKAIISDNRYGLHHPDVPSIFITHQVQIAGPKIAQGILDLLSKKHLSMFNQIWVPDYKGPTALAGKLSNSKDERISYLGPLSRFDRVTEGETSAHSVKIFGIVSGPEEQRTLFENELIELFQRDGRKAVIARGNGNLMSKTIGNIELVSHVPDYLFQSYVRDAEIVICRSGYSTIMDLAHLKRKAIIVPTPGQGEQEYLAELLSDQHGFKLVNQRQLKNLKLAEESHLPSWQLIEKSENLELDALLGSLIRQ
jgi:UDP-N-acetylglucosamine transferase subunit ALG13